jgi:hypothetical protein
MCEHHERAPTAAATSRRRRIWELSHACHCPLVGVGLPLGSLRKLVGKVTGGQVQADDYEIHVGTVSECGSRNRLSEAVQKELERRYAPVLMRFRAARDSAAVAALWQAAVASGDVAGAFWAGLSHPRCTPQLEEQMCRDLHMIQHQAGASTRVDLGRFTALQGEHASQQRELLRLQQRLATQQLARQAQQDHHTSELMQLRAQLIGRDSLLASLSQELSELRASIPGLATRERLHQQLQQTDARERALRQQISDLRRALAEATAANAAVLEEAAALPAPAPPAAHAITLHGRLAERSVLCVGGRSGNVASYRALVEETGAQFAHHDGGLEDNVNQLETSMAAADLVICQTACISHSAYWRVKDYCKRHQKRCLFIDNPSISSLQCKLEAVVGAAALAQP